MDWLRDLGVAVLGFFAVEANREAVSAIIAALTFLGAVVAAVWAVVATVWRWVFPKKKDDAAKAPIYQVRDSARGGFAEAQGGGIATGQVMGDQTIQQGTPVGHITLSLDEYEARQERLRERVNAELEGKIGTERDRLQGELDELNRRLADPDAALKAANARIAELEARIGNGDTDEEQAASAALEKGDFETAREMFERLEARTSADVKKNADAHFALGQIAEEDVRWADAAAHYAKAAVLKETFDTLYKARKFAWRAGQLDRALALGAKLIGAAIAEHGETSQSHAVALNEHALTLEDVSRFEEAEPLYSKAIKIVANTMGRDHPEYATQLNNLAGLHKAQGRLEEAELLFRQALEITGKVRGEQHPAFATSLNNLAEVLRELKRYDEAEGLIRQALKITANTQGESHPDYATSLNNLALLLSDTWRDYEAKQLFEQALKITENTLGKEHPDYAARLHNLGILLIGVGRYDEAEPILRKAVEITAKTLGESNPEYVVRLGNLAVALEDSGRREEAVALYDQALAISEATLGEAHQYSAGLRARAEASRSRR